MEKDRQKNVSKNIVYIHNHQTMKTFQKREHKSNTENIVFQSYDCAKAMTGEFKRTQRKIYKFVKKKVIHILFYQAQNLMFHDCSPCVHVSVKLLNNTQT